MSNSTNACPVCRKPDGRHDRWCDNNPHRPDRLEEWLSEAYPRIYIDVSRPIQSDHGPHDKDAQ